MCFIMINCDHEDVLIVFRKHIPDIKSRSINIVSVARKMGQLIIVSVRSNVSSINPVESCCNSPERIRRISREMGNERIMIVLWTDVVEQYALNIFCSLCPEVGSMRLSSARLNPASKQVIIQIESKLIKKIDDANLKLLEIGSKLIGHEIILEPIS
jgi:transcription antitermination factor NusA-like protein